jgi:hypothetical protein
MVNRMRGFVNKISEWSYASAVNYDNPFADLLESFGIVLEKQ